MTVELSMRYSIMLQIVASMTLVLLAMAALFAWIQNRTSRPESWRESASMDSALCSFN